MRQHDLANGQQDLAGRMLPRGGGGDRPNSTTTTLARDVGLAASAALGLAASALRDVKLRRLNNAPAPEQFSAMFVIVHPPELVIYKSGGGQTKLENARLKADHRHPRPEKRGTRAAKAGS